MAILFRTDFNDTDFPDRSGGPAGTAWNDELDAGINTMGFTPDVGGFNSDANPGSSNGNWSQILSAANRPGSLGKGFRHWHHGENGLSTSARPRFDPDARVTEYYCRMYLRFQSGWEWDNGTEPAYFKFHYVNHLDEGSIIFGLYGNASDTHRAWGLHIFKHDDGSANDSNHPSDTSWYASQGNSLLGSGQWNCYEYHVKHNTSSGVADGVFEFWFNGVRTANYTNLSFWTSPGGWDDPIVPDNQNLITPAGTSYFVDIDDLEFATTGPIGLVGGGAHPSKVTLGF